VRQKVASDCMVYNNIMIELQKNGFGWKITIDFIFKVCYTLYANKCRKCFPLTVTRKAPGSLQPRAFLIFNVTYHGYFALWSLNHWHIMYATMLAITDSTNVEKESINSPPSCHQWAGNAFILQHTYFIVNAHHQ
jgi:hypothetical protein